MSIPWTEAVFEWQAVRWVAGVAFLLRARLRWFTGARYAAVEDFCWVARVVRIGRLRDVAERAMFRVLSETRRTGRNPLVEWYLQSPASRACGDLYSISGHGSSELLRDLIVLKPSCGAEKGVILLKYARTFSAVVALLDVERLMSRYTFVLEPCWSGYWDPAILMFVVPGQPVIVQCFTDEDRSIITRIGAPLIPVSLGPADWVDAEVFDQPVTTNKRYDVVMVANWAPHKRHELLFQALSNLRDRDVRVLLVGFPWAQRTADDIRREASAWPNPRVSIEIVESVPHATVARLLQECRVFVFLSKKEGDNKALVEAMFADVPVIVYEKTIGGASGRVNASTGILSSESELPAKIRHMLDHHAEYSPREWALQHTGSQVATKVLDSALSRVAGLDGRHYSTGIVEKTNAPNLAYKEESARRRFQCDYDFILSCRR